MDGAFIRIMENIDVLYGWIKESVKVMQVRMSESVVGLEQMKLLR